MVIFEDNLTKSISLRRSRRGLSIDMVIHKSIFKMNQAERLSVGSIANCSRRNQFLTEVMFNNLNQPEVFKVKFILRKIGRIF